MESARWVNQSQPQTLVMATIWLYIRAAFGLLFGLLSVLGLIFTAGYALAGYGIANEKRVGYRVGVGITGLVCFLGFAHILRLIDIGFFGNSTGFAIISLMFDVALFSMLVHPVSRSYARVWFS